MKTPIRFFLAAWLTIGLCFAQMGGKAVAGGKLTLGGGGAASVGTPTLVDFQYYAASGHSTGGSCTSAVITLTLGTATTSGELIYVVASEVSSGLLGTVSDSGSQTYTADNSDVGIGSTYSIGTWYKFNSASGITSVTFTGADSDPCNGLMAAVGHYTHVATASAHDVSQNFGSAQSSPFASTAISTTNATDLLIGVAYWGFGSAGTWAATGSWTLETPTSWDEFVENSSFLYEQWTVTSTGSYQATGTNSGAGAHLYAAFSSFKAGP